MSLLLCVWLATAALGEDAVWRESEGDRFDGPRHQLGVSAGIRTGNVREIDAQPEISLKYLRWFSRHSAVTADIGFTNETSLSPDSRVRTFTLGAGMRFQEPTYFMSVFLEPGLTMHRHTGDIDGRDFAATRFGASISLGASVRLFGDTHLDLCLRQVLNNLESRPIYTFIAVYPSPPVGPGWDGLGGDDDFDLYNPTHVVVSYRISL